VDLRTSQHGVNVEVGYHKAMESKGLLQHKELTNKDLSRQLHASPSHIGNPDL